MMNYHKSTFQLFHSVSMVFMYCFINEEWEEQINKKERKFTKIEPVHPEKWLRDSCRETLLIKI